MAASKDDHKAGAVQKLTVLQADTTQLDGLLRGGVADVLVADLPYGVAHGSYDDQGGISRRPLDLLERAVPQWLPLLRPGGGAGAVLEHQGGPARAGRGHPRGERPRAGRHSCRWRTGSTRASSAMFGGPETG